MNDLVNGDRKLKEIKTMVTESRVHVDIKLLNLSRVLLDLIKKS